MAEYKYKKIKNSDAELVAGAAFLNRCQLARAKMLMVNCSSINFANNISSEKNLTSVISKGFSSSMAVVMTWTDFANFGEESAEHTFTDLNKEILTMQKNGICKEDGGEHMTRRRSPICEQDIGENVLRRRNAICEEDELERNGLRKVLKMHMRQKQLKMFGIL